MKHRTIIPVVATLLLALLAAGCTKRDEAKTAAPAATETQVAATPAEPAPTAAPEIGRASCRGRV